jgi:hypothetical protein
LAVSPELPDSTNPSGDMLKQPRSMWLLHVGLTGVTRKPVLQPVVNTISNYINTREKQNFQNVLEGIVGFAADVSLLTVWNLKYAVQGGPIDGRRSFHRDPITIVFAAAIPTNQPRTRTIRKDMRK